MNCASSIDSPQDSLPFYIVCRSQETAAAWRARASNLTGLDIRPILGATSYYRILADLIGGNEERPVLLGHDDIRCGFDFAVAVGQLLIELDAKFTHWGVCGNAGISIDGKHVFRHVSDPHGGPDPGLDINPVLAVDGNLLLLNLPALRAAGVSLPDFEGFHGYDIALSLECWLAGLPVLCDRRLLVIHKSGGNQRDFDVYCQGEAFTSYLATRLINHRVPTLNGPIDLRHAQNYAYLDYGHQADPRRDVVAAFDSTLATCRRDKPTLTIVCRSQLDRPELLERAMMTFSAATLEAPELVTINVLLVSDRPAQALVAEGNRLVALFPGLPLQTLPFNTDSGRYSRVAALFAAIEHCQGDYLWFVDDDDYVHPPAIRPLARCLAAGIPRLVVGHARRFEERWSSDTPRVLRESVELERLPAEGIYRAFEGDNHTPICAAVLPLTVLKNRLALVAARGDYYEDYFLLLLALTSPRLEIVCVDADICGISVRPGENTVNQLDREHWDLSYATFMNEILRLPEATSPLLWQLVRHRQPLPTAAIVNGSPALRQRLAPRLWPLLARRAWLHLRQTGWRATLARVRNYLFR